MYLTVPDGELYLMLASPTLMAQMWPAASQELTVLLQVLRVAGPTLADVFIIGLVAVMTPVSGQSLARIVLSYRRAVLTAIALDLPGGVPVDHPHRRPETVRALRVVDVAVEGRAAVGLAG